MYLVVLKTLVLKYYHIILIVLSTYWILDPLFWYPGQAPMLCKAVLGVLPDYCITMSRVSYMY